MKSLGWTEKQLIRSMMLETLERAFDKEMAHKIYLAYSEAVFRGVEGSEWFQNDEDILIEHIRPILSTLMINSAKLMFEGEQD